MSHVPTCMSHWHMNQWCRHHQMVRMSHVTHMDKSWVMWHIWIRPVLCMNGPCHTYELLMSHIHGLCHTYMGYVTHSWVMSHIHGLCHTYGCVMSCAWMSHVSHIGESCHIDESVTWHTLKSHVVHTYGWFTSHTCVWHTHVCDINRDTYVMSHTWMSQSHVTRMDVSRHTYGCVTHMKEWCHTHGWVMWYVILRWVMWSSCQIHQLLPDPWHAWVTSHTWMSHVTHVIYSGLPV